MIELCSIQQCFLLCQVLTQIKVAQLNWKTTYRRNLKVIDGRIWKPWNNKKLLQDSCNFQSFEMTLDTLFHHPHNLSCCCFACSAARSKLTASIEGFVAENYLHHHMSPSCLLRLLQLLAQALFVDLQGIHHWKKHLTKPWILLRNAPKKNAMKIWENATESIPDIHGLLRFCCWALGLHLKVSKLLTSRSPASNRRKVQVHILPMLQIHKKGHKSMSHHAILSIDKAGWIIGYFSKLTKFFINCTNAPISCLRDVILGYFGTL